MAVESIDKEFSFPLSIFTVNILMQTDVEAQKIFIFGFLESLNPMEREPKVIFLLNQFFQSIIREKLIK